MPRVYTRKFDWDEAIRRREAGETYPAIAKAFGVSVAAVRMAVNPAERERMARTSSAWVRGARCPDCGTQTTRNRKGEDNRCTQCATRLRATSVREEELQCTRCQEWKPDEDFPMNRSETPLRRYRHGLCRACSTIARREYRQRHPEAQRAYDREYYLRKRSPMQRATARERS